MAALTLDWCQAYEAGMLACGGKGYHLAKLHRYGFPVPDGGVVVAKDEETLTVHGDTATVRRIL
jgi:hypothetical protein